MVECPTPPYVQVIFITREKKVKYRSKLTDF
jgi:hypothetical protein